MNYRFRGMNDFPVPNNIDLVTYGMAGVGILIALAAFRAIFKGRR
jgi:hypothetical protein